MTPIPFDEIGFGNPSARDHLMMTKEVYLDVLLPSLSNFTPPKNSSDVTRHELKHLEKLVLSKRVVKNNMYDNALLDMLKKIFIEQGASQEFVDTICDGVAEDVIPVITKLKYHFNRPRPAQLSWYYNMNLFPDFSYFTNSPSYPSGHTCLTVVTSHVLGNLYPEGFKKVQSVIQEVSDSRLMLGVHYGSDNDMSRVVAKKVLDNAEFKIKYRL